MYDAERGIKTRFRCCVANVERLWNLKRKTYEELNGDQRAEGPMEEQSGSKTRKVKQEDASNCGTEFRSREWGVRDECGQIEMSVRRSEEFVDGKIECFVGGEENVGYVV